MAVSVRADRLQAALEQKAVELAERLGDAFVAEARRRVSRRTNRTWARIQRHPAVVQPGQVTVVVESPEPSSRYQDEGTGIYGPEGERIYPNPRFRADGTPRVLRFYWPAAGGIVFATSVAGAPGSHFWSETIDAWPQLVNHVEAGQ